MATKRSETRTSFINEQGQEEVYVRLEFVTVEDYVDMAVEAEILRRKVAEPYRVGFLSRSIRDTFLDLQPELAPLRRIS